MKVVSIYVLSILSMISIGANCLAQEVYSLILNDVNSIIVKDAIPNESVSFYSKSHGGEFFFRDKTNAAGYLHKTLDHGQVPKL
jgi:hypothetical protein